jgi:hypothetical protein
LGSGVRFRGTFVLGYAKWENEVKDIAYLTNPSQGQIP